eukprot:m.88474 g.88474  ORF g.88474 m.88474 type:complete len:529 (-) comp12268_c0_seq1:173-1759(-)
MCSDKRWQRFDPFGVDQRMSAQQQQRHLQQQSVCSQCSRDDSPAIRAAELGHFRCLQLLHEQGKVTEAKDPTMGSTPLHVAVGKNRLDCAMWLADRTGADLFAKDKIGSMPCHYAAYHGGLSCLQWLVMTSQGKAANVSTSDGGTPIHFASSRGHLNCIQYLCSTGISPNEVDDNGTTPLYFASQEGHTNCVIWLIDVGKADPLLQAHDGMCCLHAAAQSGKVATLKALTSRVKKSLRKIVDRDGGTCLHFAAAKGQLGCVNFLIKHTHLDGSEKDDIGATPVHDAAEQGQLQVLKLFAMRGVDLSPVDDDMLTPMKIAQQQGHNDCVDFLAQAITRKEQGEPEPNWFADRIRVDVKKRSPVKQKEKKKRKEKKKGKKGKKKGEAKRRGSSGRGDNEEEEEEEEEEDEEKNVSDEEQELFDALDDLEMHISRMAAVSAQLEAFKLKEKESNDDTESMIVVSSSNLNPKNALHAPSVSHTTVQGKMMEINSKHIVGRGEVDEGDLELERMRAVSISRSPAPRSSTPKDQ